MKSIYLSIFYLGNDFKIVMNLAGNQGKQVEGGNIYRHLKLAQLRHTIKEN